MPWLSSVCRSAPRLRTFTSWRSLQVPDAHGKQFHITSLTAATKEGRPTLALSCSNFETNLGLWYADTGKVVEMVNTNQVSAQNRGGPSTTARARANPRLSCTLRPGGIETLMRKEGLAELFSSGQHPVVQTKHDLRGRGSMTPRTPNP